MGQEAFMDWAKSWLDDFKLRLSYGSVGNQRISPYQFTPTMKVNSSGTYILDGGGKTTYITSPGLVSSNFTWEKVTTFNVGFDLYAFKNRLTATFDWYKRKTTGMLSAGIEIPGVDRKSTRLNSSHANISYAVFCLKKKNNTSFTLFSSY